MAKTTSEMLKQINELLALYIISGNRQTLTQVRRMVTVLLRKNPSVIYVLEEIFGSNQLSIDIL